jgi:hypothetical protein
LVAAIGDAAASILKEELEIRRGKDERRAAICTAIGQLKDKALLTDVLAARDERIAQDFAADGYEVGNRVGSVIAAWVNQLVGKTEESQEAAEVKETLLP